ncbi:hypothetical protein EGW08_004680 [Elysia chlorotica]|uniref:Uncharacterized protein n=1 Tax=Elysia chlorotica TaxID=188477 RepID=A0A3S1ABJ1_ELYCH|nr:hypothetical protein EGW08_004680 [Elysia chlorotica]
MARHDRPEIAGSSATLAGAAVSTAFSCCYLLTALLHAGPFQGEGSPKFVSHYRANAPPRPRRSTGHRESKEHCRTRQLTRGLLAHTTSAHQRPCDAHTQRQFTRGLVTHTHNVSSPEALWPTYTQRLLTRGLVAHLHTASAHQRPCGPLTHSVSSPEARGPHTQRELTRGLVTHTHNVRSPEALWPTYTQRQLTRGLVAHTHIHTHNVSSPEALWPTHTQRQLTRGFVTHTHTTSARGRPPLGITSQSSTPPKKKQDDGNPLTSVQSIPGALWRCNRCYFHTLLPFGTRLAQLNPRLVTLAQVAALWPPNLWEVDSSRRFGELFPIQALAKSLVTTWTGPPSDKTSGAGPSGPRLSCWDIDARVVPRISLSVHCIRPGATV